MLALTHEIEQWRKEIDSNSESLRKSYVERVFGVKVNSEDLVAAAENRIHFIQLVLDIHQYDKEPFLPDMYYDHELNSAVDLLERAAENKPDPRPFRWTWSRSSGAVVRNIEKAEYRCNDHSGNGILRKTRGPLQSFTKLRKTRSTVDPMSLAHGQRNCSEILRCGALAQVLRSAAARRHLRTRQGPLIKLYAPPWTNPQIVRRMKEGLYR